MNKKTIILTSALLIAACISVSAFIFNQKKEIDPVYLTLEQLAAYDGKEGRSAYVAVNGEIYDITRCRYWREGIHVKSPNIAIAGQDLTVALNHSKHGIKRLLSYPKVGFIVDSKEGIVPPANNP